MTIASLIVDVAANTVKLQKDVEQIHGSMGRIEAGAAKLKTALAGVFTVGAIVAYGKRVLDFADNLSNLSAKTGISASGLQRLDLAFQQSGVSLNTVTTAAAQLAARVISGDKSALAALSKLGLSADALKRMSMEQMFITVGDAVGRLGNKAEQIYASKTLFGKPGIELLQGLNGQLAETTAEFDRLGLIVGDRAVKELDAFGDNLQLVARAGIAWVVNLAATFRDNLIKALMGCVVWWKNLLLTIAEASQSIPILGKYIGASAETVERLRNKVQESTDRLQFFIDSTKDTGTAAAAAMPPLVGLGGAAERVAASTEKVAAATEKAAAEQAKWNESVRAANVPFQSFLRTTTMLAPAIEANNASLGAYDLIVINTVEETGRLAAAAREGEAELRRMGMALDFTAHQANNASQQVEKSTGIFGRMGDSLKSVLQGITGGGGFKGLLGNLGGGLIEGFGNILSGGLSSLISSGVGLAVKGIGKLFGESQGHKDLVAANAEIKKLQDDLLNTYGSLDRIREMGGAAGQALADAWGSQNREGLEWFKQLMGEFTSEVERNERATRENARALEEYERIGRGTFVGVTGELNVLQARLSNTEAIQRFQGAVTTFRETGHLDIRTMIGAFETLKASVGANDPQVVALEQALVHWGQTGRFEFDKIDGALLALLRGFGVVRNELQKPIVTTHTIVTQYNNSGNVNSGGDPNRSGYLTPAEARELGVEWRPHKEFDWSDSAYKFDTGTRGRFIDFGRGTPAILHGRERVMTEAEGRQESSLRAELDELKRFVRDFPRANAIAIRDALVMARAS